MTPRQDSSDSRPSSTEAPHEHEHEHERGRDAKQRHRFRKSQRLRSSSEFREVFDRRLSVADDVLVVYGLKRRGKPGRLGLTVSRKVGNAVVRNRWKRRIREVFRTHPDIVFGWDLVVLPRRAAAPDYDAIARSLPALVGRLARRIQTAPRRNRGQHRGQAGRTSAKRRPTTGGES